MIEAEKETRRREERALQDEMHQQFLSERAKVKDDLKTLQEEYKVRGFDCCFHVVWTTWEY